MNPQQAQRKTPVTPTNTHTHPLPTEREKQNQRDKIKSKSRANTTSNTHNSRQTRQWSRASHEIQSIDFVTNKLETGRRKKKSFPLREKITSRAREALQDQNRSNCHRRKKRKRSHTPPNQKKRKHCSSIAIHSHRKTMTLAVFCEQIQVFPQRTRQRW